MSEQFCGQDNRTEAIRSAPALAGMGKDYRADVTWFSSTREVSLLLVLLSTLLMCAEALQVSACDFGPCFF